MKKFFISPLPTAKLTHKKRKAKQITHITGSWFKKSITVSGTALKKLRLKTYVKKPQPMTKVNKNNEAKYICLLCIQLYKDTTSDNFSWVRTEWPHRPPSLKNIKKWPPTQNIALFLHSSTRTVSP